MSGAPRFDIAQKTACDDSGLADLLIEMQAHYGGDAPPREAIVSDLRALPAGMRVLVAREAGRVAGFAFFVGQYPGPGLKRGLYLKELYVSAASRGRGVGGALMATLLDLAVREGHARLDFTAAQENAALMAFYARFGAKRLTDRSFFRLTLDAANG